MTGYVWFSGAKKSFKRGFQPTTDKYGFWPVLASLVHEKADTFYVFDAATLSPQVICEGDGIVRWLNEAAATRAAKSIILTNPIQSLEEFRRECKK